MPFAHKVFSFQVNFAKYLVLTSFPVLKLLLHFCRKDISLPGESCLGFLRRLLEIIHQTTIFANSLIPTLRSFGLQAAPSALKVVTIEDFFMCGPRPAICFSM